MVPAMNFENTRKNRSAAGLQPDRDFPAPEGYAALSQGSAGDRCIKIGLKATGHRPGKHLIQSGSGANWPAPGTRVTELYHAYAAYDFSVRSEPESQGKTMPT